jgi:capsular exopolysaccharide synthesis family protein
MAETDQMGLVTLTAPRSPPAEAYRTLRSNINFATLDSPARNLLFTSAGSGEGKSVTVANLSVVFAQSGQSVIVVDSDLRRPILHRLFDREYTRGLTSVLVGELSIEDALQDTDVPNLRLMASGPLPPNPAELLDSERMTRFISEAGTFADLVIYDSPPTIMLADGIIMSAKLDQTVLVAESGQVTRDAFDEVIRLLSRARGNILGAVLNKLDISRSGYYYYYYYYYYYDYGQTGTENDINGNSRANNNHQMPVESPIRPLNREQAQRFNNHAEDESPD